MISPECQLVFRTADPACVREECASLARKVVDWPRVFALAERELAALGLWRALREADVPVPGIVAAAFQRSALQTDLRMQQLARRMHQTVEHLAARGVSTLLLKGAAVGALTDPSLRSRPMTDIDMLVHREDVARAAQAIEAAGWSVTTNPVYLQMLRDAHHLPHFVDPHQPGVRLELHVSLMPDDQPFAFDESALWRDARPAPAPSADALVPRPEHLSLHGCLHFAWQHAMNFGAWRTFRALAEVARLPDFSWDRFADDAIEARAGTACFWTLRLARTMGGIPVPAAVLQRLAAPSPEWARSALEHHFVARIVPGEGPTSPSESLTQWLWRAAMRPKWSGHVHRGRSDRDRRWDEALGTRASESAPQRLARHLANYRSWTTYLARTLFR